jgi:hypothetical protein
MGKGGIYLCSIDEMERRLIEEALARFPTKTRAAEVLGISLRTLYNKLHRYGLNGGGSRPGADAPIAEPWTGNGKGNGRGRPHAAWPDAETAPVRPSSGGARSLVA